MLVTGNIPNLFNGVSQQSPDLRMPTQGEAMENMYPSIADGLVKRPPTKFIKKIMSSVPSDAKVHVVNRDSDNRYIVVIMPDDLKVFDLYGNERSVSFPSGKSYLSVAAPRKDLSAFTVADYTFILNKTKTVYVGSELSPGSSGALVNIKQASYDTTYTITVTAAGHTSTAIYATPKNVGNETNPPATISTKEIAYQLTSVLTQNSPTLTSFMTFTQVNSSIHIKRDDGQNTFTCVVSDSRGDTHVYAIKERTQKFSQLPATAPHGFVVEVTGDEGSAFDNYYVKFVTDAGSGFGQGTWTETVKPRISVSLNASTMPHALIRETNGTFTFKPVDWAKRTVGDYDSAPEPVFVGRRLQDMFLFRNRLGFLSDDNLTMSAASDFFRLYPETATTIVASDPISVSSSYESVTNLQHALPFQEDLIVFSEQAQFVLESPDVLSAETAALKVATTFTANTDVKPVNSGRTVFFATSGGAYAGIREYYLDSDTSTKNAANITAHVPQYVPAPLRAMAVSNGEEILMLLPANDRSRLYMYKYYWSGGEKLQASWSSLHFPGGTIFDIVFLESTLYLLIDRGDGLYLESLDFSATHATTPETVIPHLDCLCKLASGSYNANTDRTTWTLPYADGGKKITVALAESMVTPDLTVDSSTTVSAKGNYASKTVYGGYLYPAWYEFSEQFVRSSDSGGRIASHQGRLQFRRWSLIHGNSGYFDVSVEHVGGAAFNYPFTGRVLGDTGNILGRMGLVKGKFNFPVKSRSDRVTVTISNDTHMPCSLLSAEWEAFYTSRDRGI